jgi:hypothetical protein
MEGNYSRAFKGCGGRDAAVDSARRVVHSAPKKQKAMVLSEVGALPF